MTQTKLLIGSLSNDLYRTACLIQRGSPASAQRFLDEAQRWLKDLHQVKVKVYIKNIISDLSQSSGSDKLDMQRAEKYLMYSILLQNYALQL